MCKSRLGALQESPFLLAKTICKNRPYMWSLVVLITQQMNQHHFLCRSLLPGSTQEICHIFSIIHLLDLEYGIPPVSDGELHLPRRSGFTFQRCCKEDAEGCHSAVLDAGGFGVGWWQKPVAQKPGWLFWLMLADVWFTSVVSSKKNQEKSPWRMWNDGKWIRNWIGATISDGWIVKTSS